MVRHRSKIPLIIKAVLASSGAANTRVIKSWFPLTHRTTVYTHLRKLFKAGEIHIIRWELSRPSGAAQFIPVFAFGPGISMLYPERSPESKTTPRKPGVAHTWGPVTPRLSTETGKAPPQLTQTSD